MMNNNINFKVGDLVEALQNVEVPSGITKGNVYRIKYIEDGLVELDNNFRCFLETFSQLFKRLYGEGDIAIQTRDVTPYENPKCKIIKIESYVCNLYKIIHVHFGKTCENWSMDAKSFIALKDYNKDNEYSVISYSKEEVLRRLKEKNLKCLKYYEQ